MENDGENIYGKYSMVYRDDINKKIDFPIKTSSENNFDLIKNDEDIFRLKLRSILIQYFECKNGYIGYDIFVTRHSTYHLLFWINILNSELTSTNEKETAILEIEIYFYQWISCFYNLTQKIFGFIGSKYKKKKIEFKDSALSNIGKQEFKRIIKKYKNIIKIIDVRNNVVHDFYVMNFDNSKKEMHIRNFQYNLRKEENKIKEEIKFEINEKSIIESFKSLIDLLNDFIVLIENVSSNIDIKILKERYTDKNGKMTIGFGGE